MFVANIPLLEEGLQRRTEPCVLAVRLVPDGELYAVERVKRGIYALSKLARGVDEGDIFVAVKGWNPSTSCGEGVLSDHALGTESGEWWQQAKIEDPVSTTPPSAKRAKIDVSLVFNKAADAPVDVTLNDVSPVESLGQRPSMAPPSLPMERSSSSGMHIPFVLHDSRDVDGAVFGDVAANGDTQPADSSQSPQELLDAMKEHYLQALYISKVCIPVVSGSSANFSRLLWHISPKDLWHDVAPPSRPLSQFLRIQLDILQTSTERLFWPQRRWI